MEGSVPIQQEASENNESVVSAEQSQLKKSDSKRAELEIEEGAKSERGEQVSSDKYRFSPEINYTSPRKKLFEPRKDVFYEFSSYKKYEDEQQKIRQNEEFKIFSSQQAEFLAESEELKALEEKEEVEDVSKTEEVAKEEENELLQSQTLKDGFCFNDKEDNLLAPVIDTSSAQEKLKQFASKIKNTKTLEDSDLEESLSIIEVQNEEPKMQLDLQNVKFLEYFGQQEETHEKVKAQDDYIKCVSARTQRNYSRSENATPILNEAQQERELLIQEKVSEYRNQRVINQCFSPRLVKSEMKRNNSFFEEKLVCKSFVHEKEYEFNEVLIRELPTFLPDQVIRAETNLNSGHTQYRNVPRMKLREIEKHLW